MQFSLQFVSPVEVAADIILSAISDGNLQWFKKLCAIVVPRRGWGGVGVGRTSILGVHGDVPLLGVYFQGKIPKRVCQFYRKILDEILDRVSYFDDTNENPKEDRID